MLDKSKPYGTTYGVNGTGHTQDGKEYTLDGIEKESRRSKKPEPKPEPEPEKKPKRKPPPHKDPNVKVITGMQKPPKAKKAPPRLKHVDKDDYFGKQRFPHKGK